MNYLIFHDTFFAITEYTNFVRTVEVLTDIFCYKDFYLITIEKTILFVNEHLQSITSVVQIS